MKKLTVNEIIKNEGIMIHKNKINLIIAPAGSGKTYYIFNTLLDKSEKSVYLCDTSNLRDMILKDKEIEEKVKGTNLDFSKTTFDINKYNCTVMTYAKWFYEKDKSNYEDVKTIICDEIHNLYKYKDRFDDEETQNYTEIIRDINLRAKNGVKVVGFTATYDRIKRELDGVFSEQIDSSNQIYSEDWNFINLSIRDDIKKLKDNFVSAFNDITQINYWFARTNLFKYGKKCLIYTDRITTAIETRDYINETFNELNAIALWSPNNKKYPMNKEQRRVRNQLIGSSNYREERNQNIGIIPEEYNVLIINGAYETGINILDEDVEIVIINNSSPDTIIQARSRIRKDIELLMYRVPRAEKSDLPIITVPKEYLNIKLTAQDKKELIKLLDLRDSRGRILGWGNFKKILEFNQYEVIDGSIRINKKITRVSEIKDMLEFRE